MQSAPLDGGLLYTETNLDHLFPEPFNFITSLFFLIPAIYWLLRLKGFNSRYSFLSVAAWLLLIGCIGGGIYHGFRRWSIFIFMDWLPIALLCLMASVYLWIRVLGKWYYGVLTLFICVAIEAAMRTFITGSDTQLAISLNYVIMALMVILPLILLIVKTKGFEWRLIGFALAAFTVAIIFRTVDAHTSIAIGTHFLWHTFGMLATTAMFLYLFRLRSKEIMLEFKNQDLIA